MTLKWTFTLLLAAGCTLSVGAQTAPTNTRMENAVERAVVTASAQAAQTDEEELSIRELIEAETELAYIRNTWDVHADFDKYPYLLDPEYRRSDETRRAQIRKDYKNGVRKPTAAATVASTDAQPASNTTRKNTLTEEYEPHFLYRAEELLQLDRNRHSGYAKHTLDYYYQQVINE